MSVQGEDDFVDAVPSVKMCCCNITPRRAKCISILVLIFAFLAMLAGAAGAYFFFTNTKLSFFKPPSDSSVRISEHFINNYAWNNAWYQPVYILIRDRSGKSVVGSLLQQFGVKVHQLLSDRGYGYMKMWGYYFTDGFQPERWLGGANNDTTVVVINYDMGYVKPIEELRTFIHELVAPYEGEYEFHVADVTEMNHGIKTTVLSDLGLIDAISLPIAFVCLAVCIFSYRALLVPLVTLPVAVAITFGLSYPLTLGMNVTAVAPQMMSSIVIALTFDYCLFFFARFREETRHYLRHNQEFTHAIQLHVMSRTIKACASNIIVSGVTISIAFAGTAIINVDFIRSVSLGSCIGAVSTVIVSMTVIPSFMYLAFKFFAKEDWKIVDKICGLCKKKPVAPEEDEQPASPDVDASFDAKKPSEVSPLVVQEPGSPSAPLWSKNPTESRYYRMAVLGYQKPYVILVPVLLAALPFLILLSQVEFNYSMYAEAPYDLAATKNMKTVVDLMGPKVLNPYMLTAVPNPQRGFRTDEFLAAMNALTTEAARRFQVDVDSEHVVTYNRYKGQYLANYSEVQYLRETDKAYDWMFKSVASVDYGMDSATINLIAPFDPWGGRTCAQKWFRTLRDISLHYHDPTGAIEGVYYSGVQSDSWWVMDHVLSQFPLLLGITVAVICVIVALAYRSLFMAVRMVVTMCLSVCVAVGFGVLVFHYSWLHAVAPSLRHIHGFMWLIPVLTIPLMCALALDYDIFLLARISEFRRLGFSDEAAIGRAVARTGRVISFAGVIMSIAFGTLVFAHTIMLVQFGVLVMVSVLFDTFITRPLVVPALMGCIPAKGLWFPRTMPPITRAADDQLQDGVLYSPVDEGGEHSARSMDTNQPAIERPDERPSDASYEA